MGSARWTRERLKKKLWELVTSPRVSIVYRKMDDCSAESHWWDKQRDIFVAVDPDREGLVRCVIHELLHVALESDLMSRFVYDLEEPMIDSLETLIYQKDIALKPRVMNRWRRAIREKLGEEDG